MRTLTLWYLAIAWVVPHHTLYFQVSWDRLSIAVEMLRIMLLTATLRVSGATILSASKSACLPGTEQSLESLTCKAEQLWRSMLMAVMALPILGPTSCTNRCEVLFQTATVLFEKRAGTTSTTATLELNRYLCLATLPNADITALSVNAINDRPSTSLAPIPAVGTVHLACQRRSQICML